MIMESISTTKGVYCVDVIIKAIPLSSNSKLQKINKTLVNIPVSLNDNHELLDDYFVKRIIKKENLNKYRINYELIIKKYLSGLCYNTNKS